MPFEVFRRHQRKLMAVLAILAMFSFVLADALPNLLRSRNPAYNDPVVARLYGKDVHQSDLHRLLIERQRVNQFISLVTGYRGDLQVFGGYRHARAGRCLHLRTRSRPHGLAPSRRRSPTGSCASSSTRSPTPPSSTRSIATPRSPIR